jgi:hypothetical protein
MTTQELEDLYIRSFDERLTDQQKESLLNEMKTNGGLATELSHYKTIRELTLRSSPASFGPYFAKKVVARIQNVGVQIDRQIFKFFKTYQLAVVGVVIALLALNAMFADRLNLETLFGLDSDQQTTEEIVTFDFSKILNSDL